MGQETCSVVKADVLNNLFALVRFNTRNPKALEESPETVGKSGQGRFALGGRGSG